MKSDANDTVFDMLRAAGFVLAVVLGGLLIAGFLDGWNEARPAEQAGSPVSSDPGIDD